MALFRKTTNLLSIKTIFNGEMMVRMNASFWTQLAAKWRKLKNGSERPLPRVRPTHPDSVLDEFYAVRPDRVPYERRTFAKAMFMQRKSHDMIIEHNKRIRALDKKIKSGLYDNYDYANRW